MPIELMMALVLGVGVALLLVVGFIYLKDKESARKLRRYEKAIEDLHMQLYKTQKRLKEMELEEDAPENNINLLVRKEIKNELDRSLGSVLEAMEKLSSKLRAEQQQTEERLAQLEERVKELGYFPSTNSSVDENRIIQMFQAGWSIDSIAKELRVGRGEVEFTLKLANLK